MSKIGQEIIEGLKQAVDYVADVQTNQSMDVINLSVCLIRLMFRKDGKSLFPSATSAQLLRTVFNDG